MKFYRKHRKLKIFLTVVLAILLAMAAAVGVLLYNIYKDAVAVVPKEKVDYTAPAVKIAEAEQKDDEVFNVLSDFVPDVVDFLG